MLQHRVGLARLTTAAIVCLGALAWPVVRAQAPVSPSLYSGLQLAPARPVPRRPGRRRERRAGTAQRVLLRRRQRRRLEDDRRRPRVEAGVRLRSRSPRSARSPSRRSAPDTVYVGTGESTLRDSMGYGNGMYKSTDAGKTWTHIGLEDTQHIGKVAVDPQESRTSCSSRRSGISTSAHPDRGVFRSQDGGKTLDRRCCSRTTTSAPSTSSSIRRTRRSSTPRCGTRAGRPGTPTSRPTDRAAGIFKSTDGGTTWNQLTSGLPTAVRRARPASRSRRAIRGASMRWSTTSCRRRPTAAMPGVPDARRPRR